MALELQSSVTNEIFHQRKQNKHRGNTKQLHYIIASTTTERNLTTITIIQFTVACFTALCTIKSNLHLYELMFLRCRAFASR